MTSAPRSPTERPLERVRAHYEIEKSLAMRLRQAPKPERALEGLKKDVATVKGER